MVLNRDELAARREAILTIARRHGATNVRVFGSVARDEADTASDLDLLVDMESGRSLLDVGGLVMDLQDFLGVRVDVLTAGGMRSGMSERVAEEARPL